MLKIGSQADQQGAAKYWCKVTTIYTISRGVGGSLFRTCAFLIKVEQGFYFDRLLRQFATSKAMVANWHKTERRRSNDAWLITMEEPEGKRRRRSNIRTQEKILPLCVDSVIYRRIQNAWQPYYIVFHYFLTPFTLNYNISTLNVQKRYKSVHTNIPECRKLTVCDPQLNMLKLTFLLK